MYLMSLFVCTVCPLSPHFSSCCLYSCVSVCPHVHIFFSILDPVSRLSFCTTTTTTPNVFQVRTLASAGGPDNLVMLDPAKYKARPRVPEPAGDGSSTQPKWQVGEQEYEALMRMLDNLVSVKKSFCGVQRTSNLYPTISLSGTFRISFSDMLPLVSVDYCVLRF